MLVVHPSQHQCALTNVPITLPINVLQGLFFDPNEAARHLPFNYLEGVRAAVGHHQPWEAVVRVVSPWFWAPGWTTNQIVRVADTPIVDPYRVVSDRRVIGVEGFDLGLGEHLSTAEGPPLLTARAGSPATTTFDVIHLVSGLIAVPGAISGHLTIGHPYPLGGGYPYPYYDRYYSGTISLSGVLALCAAARTRLLIVQWAEHEPSLPGQDQPPFAVQMLRALAASGGPAVLLLTGGSWSNVQSLLGSFYRELMHNQPIGTAAELSSGFSADSTVDLIVPAGGDGLLQLQALFDVIQGRQQAATDQIEQAPPLQELKVRAEQLLHPTQVGAIQELIDSADRGLTEAAEELARLRSRQDDIRQSMWSHESEGAVPLSEVADELPKVEQAADRAAQQIKLVQLAIDEEARRAPRVLNANFAEAAPSDAQGRVLGRAEALVSGAEYDFLVDVGPRWSTVETIATGSTGWPEQALPTEGDGDVIDVVLVSEDFVPNLVTGQIWVPRPTGRSYPIIAGVQAATSGPIRLRVRMPELGDDETPVFEARGRLCLYYENNLLQSAIVRVGVARSGQVSLPTDNDVSVDFVLTSTFQQLRERFSTRSLRLADHDAGRHPVAVNLTLNNDGGLRHRIVVKSRRTQAQPAAGSAPDCPTEAWAPYDPVAAISALAQARTRLQECFFEKDEDTGRVLTDGRGQGKRGLDAQTNGKSLSQFLLDLKVLAQVGNELLTSVLGGIKVESQSCDQAAWRLQLRDLIADASVIQIGRPEQSQYVLPWGLMYDYPLYEAEADEWLTCPIVRKIHEGTEPIGSRCPYHDSPPSRSGAPLRAGWHADNIVCPYGFWGLRHIIEEPLSIGQEVGHTRRNVRVGPGLPISAAVTSDQAFQARIREHFRRIGAIDKVSFVPANQATDWDMVQEMLRRPGIVYFLCHGDSEPGTDADRPKSYLSIGPRPGDRRHRVYPEDLTLWVTRQPPAGPDLESWGARRPLVFINGCHTADLAPGRLLDFTKPFAGLRAGGLLGTEVSVLLEVATEVAESLFRKLAAGRPSTTAGAPPAPIPVGEALREIRWDLVRKGNLLGLAYTLYAMSDLYIDPN